MTDCGAADAGTPRGRRGGNTEGCQQFRQAVPSVHVQRKVTDRPDRVGDPPELVVKQAEHIEDLHPPAVVRPEPLRVAGRGCRAIRSSPTG